MDIGSVASGLALSSTVAGIDVGVLKAVQNLDANVSAELFSSIGVGTFVNTSA